jgi:nucleotide-binding universal stress UspA family protein
MKGVAMKILVLLDGSKDSEAVLPAAAKLAAAARAEVTLLSVLDPLVDAAGVTALSTAEAMQQVTAERRAYLEKQAYAFGETPVQVLVEQLRHGEDVPGHIVRVAQEQGSDILVMASKRVVAVTGLILGSVARALLRLSPCPVLVVRPGQVQNA